ncbi:MAG: hypothetical protein JWN72_2969 [Thermoleophilia bacterium]|nr:hypothetical protein [Thermoleophilia bacterium]
MTAILKIPVLPLAIGAGSLVVGTGAALIAEAITTPKAEANNAAGTKWQGELDDFLEQHPVPEGSTISTSTLQPSVNAQRIGMAAGFGGLVLALPGLFIAEKFPKVGIPMAIAAGGLAIGGIAGAIIGYNAIK